MGLYKFTIAAAADSSDLVSQITRARSNGANIYLQSITDVGNLNLSINNKNVTINYDIVGTTTNSLFNWFICDTVGYETIIILYNNGTSSESTFGTAEYNRVYFNVNNKLVCNPKISETLASQFNVLRGKFDSYEAYNGEDDVIMLTKCVYNDGSNIETGETIIADNLYVSTNLRAASFKTIVKDENEDQFINIGGIFYLPYSEDIVYPSWSEKQWILPPGTVDLEWHPATMVIPEDYIWWDTSNIDKWVGGNIGDPIKKENKEFSLTIPKWQFSSYETLALHKKTFDFNSNEEIKSVYFVVKAKEDNTEGVYFKIYNDRIKTTGINFLTKSNKELCISYYTTDSNDNQKCIINKSPYKYLVFCIKCYGMYSGAYSSYAGGDIFINSEIVLSRSNFNVSSGGYGNFGTVALNNCEIKYFAQVNHDQSSDEIVKTSQLLMEKFNIN